MALKGTPITIQVSPSTYLLMTKLADLCVEYIGTTTNLQIKPGVRSALDTLYKALVAANTGTPTTDVELTALQTAGLTEAQDINDEAGYEIVMAC